MGFKLKNIFSIYMYYVIIKVLLILNIVFLLRSLNVRSFFYPPGSFQLKTDL